MIIYRLFMNDFLPFRLDSPDLLQPTRHMSAVLVVTAQLYKDTYIPQNFKGQEENVAARREYQ